ncbi:anti-anti-sigma factor [Novosphingobium sp. PhB165]|uniref:SulP family inorganic anion transporter n=1 Tax=Novosphingobium sp. PhB165 TaxID=2485105 RepID=UPI00104CE0BE|nr:SulP family inorganic anion transporter [Novosphingobium sp. PhB165]TCM19722.1 anti-anti-sigma factor [Novosphingobium sp. PhB165]
MTKPVWRDGLTGLAMAGLILPESVAYAEIAGLAPGRALAAAIAGGLAYVAVGRSRFAVVSPTSSAAAILAATLASLSATGPAREGLATVLVGMTGLIFLLLSLLRLGSLASFVSRPVLRGFAFGLAITIIVRQLPAVVGISAPSGTIFAVLMGLAARISEWHVLSGLLGAATLAVLLALRRVPQIPGALIVLVAAVVLGAAVDLPHFGIAVAGPVGLGWPQSDWPFSATALARLARLVQLAAPIALILFAESWGTMRTLALRHGDGLSPNRELASLGAANLASALVQGMPVGAGFSAGSANEAAGASSRWAAAAASLALLAMALFASGCWIARIPQPMLAAIVIVALTHALSPGPLLHLFRIRRDHWIALVAVLGVLMLGVLNGMLLAVLLSIMHLLYELANPPISELGQLGEGHEFVDLARHPEAHRVPGAVIFRPNGQLVFANAETVLGVIARRARASAARVVVLSLEESNDLDSTAIEVVSEFAQSLEKAGKHVILARAHDRVRDVLAAAGCRVLAEGSTFSVAQAAQRAAEVSATPPLQGEVAARSADGGV